MTFSVIIKEADIQRVVGTVWAQHESEANTLVTDLYSTENADRLTIKRAESREIPAKINWQ